MNFKGKFLSLTLGALVVLGTSGITTSYADSLSSAQWQMSQLQSQSDALNQQLNKDQTAAQTLRTQLKNYSASLATVQTAIHSNNSEIRSLEAQIRTLSHNITVNTAKLNVLQKEVATHLRAMYEDGDVSYLAVLFDSTSFSDLLSRLDALSIIAQQNKKVEEECASVQSNLLNQKKTLNVDYSKLLQKKNSLELLKTTDEQLQNQKHRALHLMSQKIQSENYQHGCLESQIQLTQSQIIALETQTQQAESLMQNSTYVQQATAGLASADSSALIRYAEKFLGTPYSWGGTSPSGFDCSGFTQYVFGHFGIYLNRTAADQFSSGVPVSRGNLKTGDLVFFSTYAPGASHVGIYIGNGLMIDSEDVGVAIDGIGNSYWGPRYIGARRYIKG